MNVVVFAAAVSAVVGQIVIPVTTCQHLDVANATYSLQNDVVADGTCFWIEQANVTLDLGGHSVTFDNASRIAVELDIFGEFESPTLTNWTSRPLMPSRAPRFRVFRTRRRAQFMALALSASRATARRRWRFHQSSSTSARSKSTSRRYMLPHIHLFRSGWWVWA